MDLVNSRLHAYENGLSPPSSPHGNHVSSHGNHAPSGPLLTEVTEYEVGFQGNVDFGEKMRFNVEEENQTLLFFSTKS